MEKGREKEWSGTEASIVRHLGIEKKKKGGCLELQQAEGDI